MTARNQNSNGIVVTISKFVLALLLAAPVMSVAQNMTIYSDSLVNGWQNWSYNVTLNFADTSPVHSGSDSISATITNAYGGVDFLHNEMTNTAYSSVSFWINGGVSGGQHLQVYGTLDVGGAQNTAQSARVFLNSPAPPANAWQ